VAIDKKEAIAELRRRGFSPDEILAKSQGRKLSVEEEADIVVTRQEKAEEKQARKQQVRRDFAQVTQPALESIAPPNTFEASLNQQLRETPGPDFNPQQPVMLPQAPAAVMQQAQQQQAQQSQLVRNLQNLGEKADQFNKGFERIPRTIAEDSGLLVSTAANKLGLISDQTLDIISAATEDRRKEDFKNKPITELTSRIGAGLVEGGTIFPFKTTAAIVKAPGKVASAGMGLAGGASSGVLAAALAKWAFNSPAGKRTFSAVKRAAQEQGKNVPR